MPWTIPSILRAGPTISGLIIVLFTPATTDQSILSARLLMLPYPAACCKFDGTSKTCLVGHDDGFTIDAGYLKTTFHHNWWEGTAYRAPRVRFGEVHVYNNFERDISSTGIGIGMGALIYSQHNYFDNVRRVFRLRSPGYLKDEGSIMVNDCQETDPYPDGINWYPNDYYTFPMDNAADVKDIVMQYAGAGSPERIDGPTNPPPIATPTPVPGLTGDVNGSGSVDIVDALLTAQYFVGLNPSPFITSNADVNYDGGIDIIDALQIAQYYVGILSSLTGC